MPAEERFRGANIVDAGKLSPYWGEHAARYRFALEFAEGREILDIACGTGYGLGLLKRNARSVTGVDRDFEAAKVARAECDEKTRVLIGDGTNLPFDDDSFDLVTSFETIEHLYDRKLFLSELRRVLRPGGLLILSTPNANYTKPINGIPKNKYHVYEYKPDELRVELENEFSLERFMGQKLDESIKIPPFHDAQQDLPKDLITQTKLFGWKVFNKIPIKLREALSQAIWKKPFYPTEDDYNFSPAAVDYAPVLVAVCRKI